MTKEYSLISFKPDAYRRKMTKTILKAFKTEGLKPVYHKKLWLTEDMILDYQPVTKKNASYDAKNVYLHIYGTRN